VSASACIPKSTVCAKPNFAHILGTFPLLADPLKIAALNVWGDVQTGLIQ
jgi:hypothetical protein